LKPVTPKALGTPYEQEYTIWNGYSRISLKKIKKKKVINPRDL